MEDTSPSKRKVLFKVFQSSVLTGKILIGMVTNRDLRLSTSADDVAGNIMVPFE